jgi:hypothetical protein
VSRRVCRAVLDQNIIGFRVYECDGSIVISTLTWIQFYGPFAKNLSVDTISNGG